MRKRDVLFIGICAILAGYSFYGLFVEPEKWFVWSCLALSFSINSFTIYRSSKK